jgi:hypothetical protein
VQSSGELIVLVRELAARVQPGEDQFDAGNPFVRMNVDWHAAAVVADFDRAVGMDDDVDRVRVPGQRFVDRVVDDFLNQVIRPRRVGVHAGAALDRFQARQDFDVGGVVSAAHLARRFQENR